MKLNFGETLQYVLEQHNLTQKEAADALHISPQSINSYIKNRRVPDLVLLQHILQHFQLDANIVLQIDFDKPREYITPHELKVLRYYRKLDANGRKLIIFLLEKLPTL